ncbi:MAG: transposase, partial [Clostridiales bacterium]|nr:transposase [Clostridiales bacterium]
MAELNSPGPELPVFCTLLSMTLHDGNEVTGQWAKDPLASESHSKFSPQRTRRKQRFAPNGQITVSLFVGFFVVRLIHEACRIAGLIAPSLLLPDRYFLTVPALLAWLEAQKLYGAAVTIITRVKSNYNAYEFPDPRDSNKRKRGRPPKKGKDVKLQALFASQAEFFTQTKLTMYGQKTAVS